MKLKKEKTSAFGKIILKRLVELEKNRSWLAQEIGTSLGRIHDYITGKYAPSARALYKIAKVLEINSDELLTAIANEEEKAV